MYCVTCQNLSLSIICKNCLENLWYIESKRELENGLKVFSSFALSELRVMLLSKNNVIGSRVLNTLGIFGVKRFFQSYPELLFMESKKLQDSINYQGSANDQDFGEFQDFKNSFDSKNLQSSHKDSESSDINATIKKSCAVVCIRNRFIGAYSHSAILARCFKKYGFNVKYNALISHNDVRFTTLNLKDRSRTSRDFTLNLHKKFSFVIIVDDIVTTGQTLLQASEIIKQHFKIPLFAWTLCDAKF